MNLFFYIALSGYLYSVFCSDSSEALNKAVAEFAKQKVSETAEVLSRELNKSAQYDVQLHNDSVFKHNILEWPGAVKISKGYSHICKRTAHIREITRVSILLSKFIRFLSSNLELAVNSSYYANHRYCDDCTDASQRLLVVYELPNINNADDTAENTILTILMTARDLLTLHGADFLGRDGADIRELNLECSVKLAQSLSSNFHLVNRKLTKKIQRLQRDNIMVKSLLQISRSLSDFFNLAPKASINADNGTLRLSQKVCKNLYSRHGWNAPLISLSYLGSLHMEIIDLPKFFNKGLLLEKMRSMKYVKGVEEDVAFLWQQSVPFARNDFMKNVSSGLSDNDGHQKEFVESTSKSNFLPQRTYIKIANEVTNAKSRVKRSPPALNDPYFNEQWALSRSYPAVLDLVEEWPELSILDELNSVVAVIDSGLDLSHSDLQGQIWINEDEIPGNGIDDDGNGFIDDVRGWDFTRHTSSPQDDHGHGTQVSGIIAAASNNSIGVASVCPFCKIMALKVSCTNGVGASVSSVGLVIMAINYALQKNVKTCNYSNGGKNSFAFKTAIDRAAMADMIIVTAAGDSRVNIDLLENEVWPASSTSSNVVAVTSVDVTGSLSNFSNYGPRSVMLGAPGSFIWTTNKHGGYICVSGSSYATSYVTGIVALLRAVNQNAHHVKVIEQLVNRGNPFESLRGWIRTGKAISFYNIFFQLWFEATS